MEFDTDRYMPHFAWVCAIPCVLAIEYLYFTNAEEVRLLFVILLALVGGGIGAVIGALLCLGIAMILLFGPLLVGAVLVVGAGIGIIYLLYSIIVWTN